MVLVTSGHDAPAAAEGADRLQQARMQLDAGRLHAAVDLLRDIVGDEPAGCEAAALLGIALNRVGRHAEAAGYLEAAARAEPENLEILRSLANACETLGRWDAAIARHRELLRIVPNDLPALRGLANALYVTDRKEAALSPLKAVLRARPHDAVANYLLGSLDIEAGRLQDAVTHLRRAAEAGDNPRVSNNLIVALERLGRHEEALPVAEALVAAHPSYARGWYSLSGIYRLLERHAEAESALRRVLELDPGDAYAQLSLARLERARERIDDSELAERLKRVVAGAEGKPDLLLEVAKVFQDIDGPDIAAAIYRYVLRLKPDCQRASSQLLHLKLETCEWQDYDDFARATLAQVDRAIAEGRPLAVDLFNLFTLPIDNALIGRAARHQARQIETDVARRGKPPVYAHCPRRRDRIRVGYLLPYTHFFSMPLVMKELAAQHDRERFEVFGYSRNGCDRSAFSRAFRGVFDRFADVPKTSPHAAADRINLDEVDILVDVTGHTPANCLEVMALRPAPVQVHAIGYSLTTGADYIDYLVSDRGFMPPEARAHCSEAVAWLPDVFLPAVRNRTPTAAPTRADCGLPDDGPVLINFNDPYKFAPLMFRCWLRILGRVPSAVLWLGAWTSPVKKNLRALAERAGIDPARIVFAGIVDHAEHVARLSLADLALDNLHHGGGVTSSDALAAGVPLLTLEGPTPPSRLGATISRAAGLPDLIVGSPEAYEETAVRLLQDEAALRGLQATLRAGLDGCALFDMARYCGNLERAYEEMWRRRIAGEPAADFDVAALPTR